jgi:hypothetical protein
MSNKPVPIFTTGGPGYPSRSVPVSEMVGVPCYNAYTGARLPGIPTMSMPIGSKPGTFHGGLLIDKNGQRVGMFHHSFN